MINRELCERPLWYLYFQWTGCEWDDKNTALQPGKMGILWEVWGLDHNFRKSLDWTLNTHY